MAASHMSRPYPPIYHTPQSNSPVSVASPTAADHRSVYSTPPLSAQMYAYQNPYTPISAPPHSQPSLASYASQMSGPMLMSQAPSQSMTATKHGLQMPQRKVSNPPTLHTAASNQSSAGNTPAGPNGNVGTNAAPGPIPATTPLVVRQDTNGVQWIAFEYSRDRVKMEYTIRCDVESVDVNALPAAFKAENCVYPRACCSKEQYRGNRLTYETECNNVGWALAELNECLRGKRGLIQRAVDSWRNSNQDPRMRSRRVRRMAKINSRRVAAQQQQNQMAGVMNAAMNAGVNSPGGLMKGGMMGGPVASAQLHHHHRPATSAAEDMGYHHHSVTAAYDSATAASQGHMSPQTDVYSNGAGSHHHHAPQSDSQDIRQRQVFNDGYSGYPSEPINSASLAPSLHDPLDLSAPQSSSQVHSTSETQHSDLFSSIPDHKKRKFILVDDPDRGSRTRIRCMLDQVRTKEMPESARKANSVYPRSFHSTLSPPTAAESSQQNMILIPMLDGSEFSVSSLPTSLARRRKEEDLNELGYRMSWSQPRTFEHRPIFLQKALDAYRNKMRSSMMGAGQDVLEVAPHLETRPGKRRWMERNRRSRAD